MYHVGPHGQTTPFEPRELAESLLAGPPLEPPYEGALQDEFAWHLVKYLREDAVLRSEVEIPLGPARGGPALFTLDFVVEAPRPDGSLRRVAFECGGSRGLRDHQRQARRDAALVASGTVDAVYRLRGSDLLHHMEDCLFLVSLWEDAEGPSSPFSERGRINLRTLASPEARVLRLRPEQPSVLVAYAPEEEGEAGRALWHAANGTTPFVLLRRFDRRHPDVWAPLVEPAAPADGPPLRKAS